MLVLFFLFDPLPLKLAVDKAGEPVPKGNEKPVCHGFPQTAKRVLAQKFKQRTSHIHGNNSAKGVEGKPGRVDKLCGFENGLPHGTQQLVFEIGRASCRERV